MEKIYDKSGPYPKEDLVGHTFDKLIVLSWAGKNKHRKTTWLCECECGNQKIIEGGNLKQRQTKSCGCLRVETKTKHGYTGKHNGMHPLYKLLYDMKTRCYNKNSKSYKDYGGRGIKICSEWLNSVASFVNWGLQNGYEKGLTIERIDNDGDYCPENCCFITKSEQNNNQSSNHLLTYNGKTKNIAQWAKEKGIKPATLQARIQYGWTIEDALLRPVRPLTKKTKY